MMMEQQWKELIQRRVLRRHALHVSELAASIQVTSDFTSDSPRILAKIIEGISRKLNESIDLAPEIDLPYVNFFLIKIAAHLRFVDRSRASETPWSLVQPAKAFLGRQIQDKIHFIIRPQWHHSYAIFGDLWEFYKHVISHWTWFPLEDLEKEFDIFSFKPSDRIFCISFPRVERNNALMHCLWGHEFGHILASEWMKTRFVELWAGVEEEIRARIRAEVSASIGETNPLFREYQIDSDTSAILANTLQVAKDGLTEIICDHIGVHLFGPSAVAAAIEFAARFDLDTSPLEGGNYPPWRYRLRLQLEYCKTDLERNEGIGYPGQAGEKFVAWLLQARSIISDMKEQRIIEAKTVTREAYRFIASSWPVVSVEIIKMLPEASGKQYNMVTRFERLEQLVSRLAQGIPPNEIKNSAMNPSSLEDILTSGWIHKIAESAIKDGKDADADIDTLENLVLKACESSWVQTVWGPKLNGEIP